MSRKNQFSPVASDCIERIRDLAEQFMDRKLPMEARKRVLLELELHQLTLQEAFRYRRAHGPTLGGADSDAYFNEKLGGMMEFARMAVNPQEREGYTPEKIIEHLSHYSHRVAQLVATDWSSRSRRPVSDTALKDSSFEHREALQRLATR